MAERGKQPLTNTPALVAAARDGDVSLVIQLVKQGHAVNDRDKNSATALYWACCRGHDAISQFLINAGSDITARVNWGATALLAAADNGQEICVRQLLRENVDVNTANDRGDTPLHAVAYRGYANILCLLMDAGANPFLKNSASMTPVQEAYGQQQYECVKLLQKYMDDMPGFQGSISLSNPSLASTTSYPRHLEESYNSWPCVPASDKSRLSHESCQEKNYSLRLPKKDHIFYSDKASSLYSSNKSATFQNPGYSILSESTIEPTNSHSTASSDISSSFHESGFRKPLNLESSSFSELSAEGESGILSYDSFLSRAVSVHSKQGCEVPPSKCSKPSSLLLSEFNQGIKTETYYPADVGITQEYYKQHQIQQTMSSPPKIIPRERKSKLSDFIANDNTLPLVLASNKVSSLANPVTHTPVRRSGRSKYVFKDVLPGVNVSEFVEQLQVQLVELQEKLIQSNALTAQLRDQLLQVQSENAELKTENAKLRCLFQQQGLFGLRARGESPGDFSHASCLPELPQSADYITDRDGSDVSARSRCAVESSDNEGNIS